MQNVVQHLITVVFIVLVLLLIALWGLTPIIAQTLLKDFFQQHNTEFNADSFSVNPFTTTIYATNIEVTSKRGKELTFAKLQFELDILPLFKQTIRVAKMTGDGLQLGVEKQKQGWKIGGVLLSEFKESPKSEPGLFASAGSWQVRLPLVVLNDSTISIKQVNTNSTKQVNTNSAQPIADEIKINRLHISKVEIDGNNWRGSATLSAALNGATVDLSTEVRFRNDNLTQWIDIQLITAKLSQFRHYLPDAFSHANVNLSLIGEVVVNHKAMGTILTASAKRVQLDRVTLPVEPFSVESERTEATIDSLQIMLPAVGNPTLLVDGQLKSTMTRITTDQDRKLVAAWDELRVTPVSIRRDKDDLAIDIVNLEIDKLTASQSSTAEAALPALATMNSLVTKGIKVKDRQAAIDTIDITDLSLQLLLDKERKLTTLVTLHKVNPSFSAKNQASRFQMITDDDSLQGDNKLPSDNNLQGRKKSENVTLKQPYSMAVNRLTVDGNSVLDVSDQGITPSFKQRIVIHSLALEGVNTGNPDQPMHVVLEGQADNASKIKTDTRVWPLKDSLTFDTRTELRAVNLPSLSPYIEEALGDAIGSGQLNMRIAMNIDQGLIDGQSSVELQKFDLAGGTSYQKRNNHQFNPKKIQNGAMSLNRAVAILKERSDNIEFSIPISGNTSSPHFTWPKFISLLLKNALLETAANTDEQSLVPSPNTTTVTKIGDD